MLVPEPISQAHLDRMLKRCSTIDDLPIAVPLHGTVSLIGPHDVTANAIRALLLQVAVLHAGRLAGLARQVPQPDGSVRLAPLRVIVPD